MELNPRVLFPQVQFPNNYHSYHLDNNHNVRDVAILAIVENIYPSKNLLNFKPVSSSNFLDFPVPSVTFEFISKY